MTSRYTSFASFWAPIAAELYQFWYSYVIKQIKEDNDIEI